MPELLKIHKLNGERAACALFVAVCNTTPRTLD